MGCLECLAGHPQCLLCSSCTCAKACQTDVLDSSVGLPQLLHVSLHTLCSCQAQQESSAREHRQLLQHEGGGSARARCRTAAAGSRLCAGCGRSITACSCPEREQLQHQLHHLQCQCFWAVHLLGLLLLLDTLRDATWCGC